jgi:hypothetical protein
MPKSAEILYLIGVVVYGALMFFVYRAYQVAKWSLRPDLDALKTYSAEYPDRTMRAWVANECIQSVKTNEPRLKAKTSRIAWALRLLALDALILAFAAFFAIR